MPAHANVRMKTLIMVHGGARALPEYNGTVAQAFTRRRRAGRDRMTFGQGMAVKRRHRYAYERD
jgi:hypothetical protein